MTSLNLEDISIKDLFFDLWILVNRKRKIQLFLLLNLMIISSFSEIISLVSIIPFLQVLIEPDSFYKFEFISNLAISFGLTNPNQVLLPVTIIFVGAAIITASIRLTNLWMNNVLAASIGSDFSCQAFRKTIYKPYKFHIQNNTSSMINTTTKEVNSTVEVVRLILQFITSSLIVLGLILGLVFINWQIAILSILLFSSTYLFLGFISKKRLLSNSRYVIRNNFALIKALQEGLGAIRDVLLHNSQKTYLDLYKYADRPMRIREAESNTLASFPRFFLEALGIVLISIIAYFLTVNSMPKVEIISLLGTLALAAQRMLPAMQQVYSSWASIKANLAAVYKVITILNSTVEITQNIESSQKIDFKKEIVLENISFRYSKESPLVLDAINLTIKKGEKIGVIGETGCGKSTFLDILMGLLEPTSGKIYVDNLCINEKSDQDLIKFWRNSISHVPQDIYLSDTSIAENIAFGVKNSEIDFEEVKLAAKKAKILKFITSKASGFRSVVGERGISLSGGQIQRIAIARAIYKNAEILIMDEATSALDNKTEQEIISEIHSLSKEMTVLMVAHRLSSLDYCDRVIKFENGKISF